MQRGLHKTRKSFYFHYDTKEALLDALVLASVQEVSVNLPPRTNGWERLILLCQALRRYRSLAVLPLAGRRCFYVIREFIASCLKDIFLQACDEDGFISLLADGILLSILSWLGSVNPASSERFVEELSRSFRTLIHKCRQGSVKLNTFA